MSINNPIDPVNPAGLYKPLDDTELARVRPMSGGIAFLILAGLGLILAGLTLAPDHLPEYLIGGGVAALTLAFNAAITRARGLHKRVAALSQALRTQLAARGYR